MEKFVKSENVSNEKDFFYTYLISQSNHFGYTESQLVRYCDGLKAFLSKFPVSERSEFLMLLDAYYHDLTVSQPFDITYTLRLFQIFRANNKVLELAFQAKTYVKTDLKSNPAFIDFLLNNCLIPLKKVDVFAENLNFTLKVINSLKINNSNFDNYTELLETIINSDVYSSLDSEKLIETRNNKYWAFIIHVFKNLSKNNFAIKDLIKFYRSSHRFAKTQYDLKFIKLLDLKLNLNYLIDFKEFEINKLHFIYKIKPVLFENVSEMKCKDVTAYQFLLALFENYKVASLFLYNYFNEGIYKMNDNEYEWFMDVLKGKNLIYSKNLPFKLTKKIAHEFSNLELSKPLRIKEGLIFAALKRHQVNTEFSMAVLRKLTNLDNIDFWIETLSVLYKKGLHLNKLDEFVDYIRYKVFRCKEEVDFHAISLKKLQKDVDDWHHRVYNSIPFKNEYTKFKKSNIVTFDYQLEEENFQIVQLLKTEELIEEGETLEHCVATYNSLCAKNYLTIFSLRKKDEINEYHSLITIEVNHDEITQMRGLKNRKSNAIEKLIIKEWAYKNQLKIV
jgi:hypothetical protein